MAGLGAARQGVDQPRADGRPRKGARPAEGDPRRPRADAAAEEADLRALWVAGLIITLPGLAIEPELELELECRPAILNAGTTLERVEAARLGIQRCIERLREL